MSTRGARFKSRLPQVVDTVERKAARGVLQALVAVGSAASVRTPIDTSDLLNSQYRRVGKDGTRIVGTIGYTAEYAQAVHDPENRQTFRRSTATKEFLTLGAQDAAPTVRKVLIGALRVGRGKP